MSELTSKQSLLIEEFKDDLYYYKDELGTQISNQKVQMIVGGILAVVIGATIIIKPDFLVQLEAASESINRLATIVGETLPVAFITKAFNYSKTTKKKLKGLRVFDKSIKRMERSLVPNTEQDIIDLEEELVMYINT
jgi:hypothetical protein